jgi:RimJ/RimL family protein N-acetyltransferase
MLSPRSHVTDATPRKVWHLFATEFFGWCLEGAGHWVIERRDGITIGVTGISHPSYYPEPEMGWALYDGFEGQGYATEAASAARDWAKGRLRLTGQLHPRQQRALRRGGRTARCVHDPDAPTPADVSTAHLSRLPPLGGGMTARCLAPPPAPPPRSRLQRRLCPGAGNRAPAPARATRGDDLPLWLPLYSGPRLSRWAALSTTPTPPRGRSSPTTPVAGCSTATASGPSKDHHTRCHRLRPPRHRMGRSGAGAWLASHPEARGNGFATEAARAARDWGQTLLPGFVSYVHPTTPPRTGSPNAWARPATTRPRPPFMPRRGTDPCLAPRARRRVQHDPSHPCYTAEALYAAIPVLRPSAS